MTIIAANISKRMGTGLLWCLVISLSLLGPRLVHSVSHEGYYVRWWGYVIMIGFPLLAFLLPRILSAKAVAIDDNSLVLCYLFRSDRAFNRATLVVQTKNASVLVVKGDTLGGGQERFYLFSSGFEKSQWAQLSDVIHQNHAH